jgi:hypothetical protein
MFSTQDTAADQQRYDQPVPTPNDLGHEVELHRNRLVALRAQLNLERERAISPAVARALEMSEIYLFLGLTYLGHTQELFPGEGAAR